mmetsp:Transcript_83912/g.224492  ORF Transcript_83912/g.224492 Transcript_83912/m.224492 type:complete len:145 (+) Transcript_83912:526-960(+)
MRGDAGGAGVGLPPLMVCPPPLVARWAHVTDVFAVGAREWMASYMTMFRGCLYEISAPLYHTHPRWDSEEKLEVCLKAAGVPWRHVPQWRFVAVRAASSCGSTGCWQTPATVDAGVVDGEPEGSDADDSGLPPSRFFKNGTRAF